MNRPMGDRGLASRIYAAFMIPGILVLIAYAIYHFFGDANLWQGAFNLLIGLAFLLGLVSVLRGRRPMMVFRLSLLLMFIFFQYLTMLGGPSGFALVWNYLLPVSALFFLGKKEGGAWTLAFLLASWFTLSSFNPFMVPYAYSPEAKLRFFLTMAILTIMLIVYQHIRDLDYRKIVSYVEHIEKVETSLRQSEDKFRKSFEHLPDPMLIVEMESGVILDVNQALVETFGRTKEGLIGKTTVALGIWSGLDQRAEWLERFKRTGGRMEIERTIPTVIAPKEFLIKSSIMEFGGRTCVLFLCKDISKLKEHENILLKRSRELTFLNDLGKDLAQSLSLNSVIDTALNRINGFLSPKITLLFLREGEKLVLKGHSPATDTPFLERTAVRRVGECLCGLAASQRRYLYSSDIHQDPRCTLSECRNIGLRSVFAAPIEALNRNLGVLLIAYGETGAFADRQDFLEAVAGEIASAINNARLYQKVESQVQELEVRLTQIKLGEKTLAEKQDLFRTVFDLTPHPMTIARFRDNVYLNVNQAFLNTTGYIQEEVIGQSSLDLGILSRGMLKKASEELSRRGAIDGLEVTAATKSGEKRDLLMSVRTLYIDGELCSIASGADLTDIKQLETHLRRSQKMEALGALAGGIAHDFNNLLTIISGNTQLGLRHAAPDDPSRKNLESIQKAGSRAIELVQHILAFSRRRERKRSPVEIGPIVKETLKLMRASIPASIDIRQRIVDQRITMLADPTEIHQIVMNLCTNAYHAMGEDGGILDVALEPATMSESDAGRGLDLVPGDYLVLRISDTGPGIDPAIRDKIFDPYFTTKEPGVGTGLGLAVVNGIVRDCRGAIQVYSEPGQGATFNVYFPTIQTAAVEIAAVQEDLVGGTERILLVEDEEAVAEITRESLLDLGYQVEVHKDGAAALEAFERQPEAYDLVLTDQTMPRMTGLKLAARVKAIRPDLPIILSTGFSASVTEESSREAGIQEVLMKPIHLSSLASRVRRVLDERSENPGLAENPPEA